MKTLDTADNPTFSAPWQAQAFALTVHLNEQNVFTWSEWGEAFSARRRRSAEDGITDAPDQYYQDWISALERILIDKGAASVDALSALKQAWVDAYVRTPHGHPIEPGPIAAVALQHL